MKKMLFVVGEGGGVKTDCSVLIKGTLYVGEDKRDCVKIRKISVLTKWLMR